MSGVIFNPDAGKIHGAKIVHAKNEVEDVPVFMERVLGEMISFFRNITYLALNEKLQMGMKIGATTPDGKVFQWVEDPKRNEDLN